MSLLLTKSCSGTLSMYNDLVEVHEKAILMFCVMPQEESVGIQRLMENRKVW